MDGQGPRGTRPGPVQEIDELAMTVATKETPSRTASRERRRRQLIDATMKCIGRKGIGSTTLGDVAREAGLSAGIVNLHFKSKDNLLRETLRTLAGEYRAKFEREVARENQTAAEKLLALMELDIRPSVCQPSKLAVWFAFWGEVKSRPTYRRICDELDRHYDDVVRDLCAEIIDDGNYENADAASIALALNSLTNGLWLSCLISPKTWSRAEAATAIRSYLASTFPDHFDRAPTR